MGKVYRTAQGRELDIERLRLQNEMVPVIGNMKVNARGDQLGSGGKILKTREQIMDDHYRTRLDVNTNVPQDGPIPTTSRRAQDQPIPTSRRAAQEFTPGNLTADVPPLGEQAAAEQETGLKGGLARAVKRAADNEEKKGLRRI